MPLTRFYVDDNDGTLKPLNFRTAAGVPLATYSDWSALPDYPAPTLGGTVEGASVLLEWTAVTDAETYEVEKIGGATVSGIDDLAYRWEGLSTGTHQFRVRTSSPTVGSWSATQSFVVEPQPGELIASWSEPAGLADPTYETVRTGGVNAAGSVFTIPAGSATPHGLLRLDVFTTQASGVSASSPTSVTGGGVTWTRATLYDEGGVNTQDGVWFGGSGRFHLSTWLAVGVGDGSEITITHPTSQAACSWMLFRVAGTVASSVANAVVQADWVRTTSPVTSQTLTMRNAFASSNNLTFGTAAFGSQINPTAIGGFTEVARLQVAAAGNRLMQAQRKNSADTTIEWAWSGEGAIGAIGLELARASSSGTPNPFDWQVGTAPTYEPGPHGQRMRFVQQSGQAAFVAWTSATLGAPRTSSSLSWITAFASGPSQEIVVARAQEHTAGNPQRWRLSMLTNGRLRIRDGSNAVVADSLHSVPVWTDLRIEVKRVATSLTVAVYNPPSSSSPSFSFSGTVDAGGENLISVGNTLSGGDPAPQFTVDEVRYTDSGDGVGAPPVGAATLRVNLGGPTVFDPAGVFQAGSAYMPNANVGTATATVEGASSAIYQTEAWQYGSTSFPMPEITPGRYLVGLHFAEKTTQYMTAGGRVVSFGVGPINPLNPVYQWPNVDIWSLVGPRRACTLWRQIDVTGDRGLTIEGVAHVREVKCEAITVVPYVGQTIPADPGPYVPPPATPTGGNHRQLGFFSKVFPRDGQAAFNPEQTQLLGASGEGQLVRLAENFQNTSWTMIRDGEGQYSRWKNWLALGGRQAVLTPGMVPMFGPSGNWSSKEGTQEQVASALQAGAAGSYDWVWTGMAQQLVPNNLGTAYIRIGHEFNGGYYPWRASADPVAWKNYFRRIVNIIRQYAPDVMIDWNPLGATTLRIKGGASAGPVTDAYPGDQYVDIIGCDLYDIHYAQTKTQAWTSSTKPILDYFRDYALSRKKPLSIPEWGNWGPPGSNGVGNSVDADNDYYIQKMHEYIEANNVIYHVHFNVTAADGDHKLTTPTQFPQAAAMFNSLNWRLGKS